MNSRRKIFKVLLGVGLIPLFLLTLGGDALSQTCTESPPELVSWWPGDGNAQDIQGNNNGTLQGGTTFSPGMVGQAYSFDGIDDIVEVPDSPTLNIGIDDFSIVAWIRMDYTGNLQTIMDKRVFSDAHVELGYSFSAFPVGLCFQLANGSSYINYQSSAIVQDGKFHHVAVTVRRKSTDGGKIFKDGAVVLVFNPTPYSGNLDNTANFRIGGHSLGYPSGGVRGLIDEMGFFKRALTADEISMLYNEGSGCKIPRVPYPGDITNDGIVDLQDAISGLQVAAGISTYGNPLADVNGDKKLGTEETIYVLQRLAGLRNRSPELVSIGNKLVDEGSLLSFIVSASDPDGDVLNYTSSNLPFGAIFNPDTKTFSWTPTYSQSGMYDVTFTVMDIQGASDSETIAITVSDILPVESWSYLMDGGQGYGNLTFAEQPGGSITVDGNWTYYYSGFATGSFTDVPVTIEGASASFIATGTATHPYVSPSAFNLTVNVITNNGQASGTYVMTFSNPSWPSLSGSVAATRTSGSGITQ